MHTSGQFREFIERCFGGYQITGTGNETNINVVCPICYEANNFNYQKKKLAIKLSTGILHCWVCGYKARSIYGLLRRYKPVQAEEFITQFDGAGLGRMFNAPYLKGVGRWLGSGIGSIFGSGDYTMVGSMPKYNVLTNGAQIPQFQASKASNIVCHREYLGDIVGTTDFTNRGYPLNPGIVETFPWLSSVADNYAQYRFHGLIFEFRPLITDFVTSGAPGVVVMATNYNADDPIYSTKQEMENSEFAVSVKPTMQLMHGVECAVDQSVLRQMYIRTGELPTGQDKKFTDLGNFQFATQANPTQTLGELWVSYCVEFFKPRLPTDVGGNVRTQHTIRSSVVAATSPLGTIGVSSLGDIGDYTNTPTSFSFTGQPGNYYSIEVTYSGTVAAAITYPVASSTNASFVGYFNGSASSQFSPAAGVVCSSATHTFVVKCISPAITISFGVAGTLPTGTTYVDIILNQVSTESVA